jgi:hypothetical protein
MAIADLPAILGAIFILAGIGLVIYQFVQRPPPPKLGIDFGATRRRVGTSYPGIVMIVVGSLLMGVGALTNH